MKPEVVVIGGGPAGMMDAMSRTTAPVKSFLTIYL